MKQPEEVREEFTREWLEKAEEDFLTAKHLLKSGPGYLSGSVFHAQQAAEKYLKAFLVWHQIEFQKTHDISLLLKLAASAVPEIGRTLEDAVTLTPYGVEYRYPGDYPHVTMTDAGKALDIAERVRADIRARLPRHIVEQ